ncbi:MAG: glycosyltransferase [Prevotella sp.]
MNILFLLKSLETGGLEVVTAVLANKFMAEGHNVCVFSFLGGKNSIAKRFDYRIRLTVAEDYSTSKQNVEKLRSVLVEDRIEIIINQWGLPLIPIKTARRAAKGLGVKIISVYHNAPNFNGRIQKMNIALMGCENPLKRIVLKSIKAAYKEVTSHAMGYIYRKSDMFLVLSDCYIEDFQKFTGVKDVAKLRAMTNPVTVDKGDYIYDSNKKLREIIYVGRLDFVQKRVHRVIDTWNYLEEKFPDWKLTIIGDGEDRANLEGHVKALGLKHVSFESFKSPIDYYKRASILMLTSDFEGFPLVLAECMSIGVVPVVLDSYSAVHDIIEDGKDGHIVPYCKQKGFIAKDMADKLEYLMNNKEKRNVMALAAIEKSKKFSIDRIFEKWMSVFDGLKV